MIFRIEEKHIKIKNISDFLTFNLDIKMTYPYENNQFNRKTSFQNCTTHKLNTCDMKKNNNFQSKLRGSHSVEEIILTIMAHLICVHDMR